MGYEFRMKTGFFETKTYALLVHKGELVLSPKEIDDGLITIPEESILSITIKSHKSLEMEIQTDEKLYHGQLDNKTDYENSLIKLKKVLTKILCEYEGGN